MESRGIIMFNRGNNCIVRAIVAFETLRRHWDGPVTIYLEDPYPHEFDKVCKGYNIDIVHNEKNHELKTLVRKVEMFSNPPYDRTMWLDLDIVVNGSIDEMFDYLDDADISIPHFCGWKSNGRTMAKRVRKFEGIAEDRHIKKALEENPAVNTGVLTFRKSKAWTKFVQDWVELAQKGSKAKIFIPDEVAFQVLCPSTEEWGLKVNIAPIKFNVSVKFGGDVEDKRIIHFHGKKHCLDFPLCNFWKEEFEKMCENNTANINHYLQYADKRLDKYLKVRDGMIEDVTIVTACDEKYVEFLKLTFPNWRKYKNIDDHPVIVFVHGIELSDERLDFLKLPNVTLIPWSFPSADNHREEMLSAFVFGAAENVKTDYWLKLDADSYAINDKPLYNESMKQFAYCGHKWGYSRPDHIRGLDEWAKGHWKRKLKNAGPMIEEGRIDGRRFYHDTKRTISYIQLHKLKFTKFCVSLLRKRKLPVPTQDTFMFFVCNRFDPHLGGTAHFKRDHGFYQGNSRRPVKNLEDKLKEVDAAYDLVEVEDTESVNKEEVRISDGSENPYEVEIREVK
jgi:lipopolysaccharide biosynthesis glycosyltransferase